MRSISKPVSTPKFDGRKTVLQPHDPTKVALHADRIDLNEPSCSGLLERSMLVGIVLLLATRASTVQGGA
eukprot:5493638-Prymnesium_polylepis.2